MFVGKIRSWRNAPKKTSYSNEQKKMLAVMHGWRQRRTLLKVEVFGYEGMFQSFLINLDLEDQCLVLDELFPKIPMPTLFSGQRVKVTVESGGVEFFFNSLCLKTGTYEGLPACWLEMPSRLTQIQRRQAFRLPLAKVLHRRALFSVKGVWVQGVVENISTLGAGIELLGDWGNQIAIGDCLPTRISIEGILESDFKVAVRRINFNSETATTFVGITYVDFGANQRNELAKRIIEKQRLTVRLINSHQVA